MLFYGAMRGGGEKGLRREEALIQGVVQGVGFRPYLYRLAGEHGLSGRVANHGRGVVLELQGKPAALEAFFADLVPRKPPLAQIQQVSRRAAEPVPGETRFVIVPSRRGQGAATALVPPDVALCADCRAEIFDPADRRYHYPFTNCTNCGPRYTIIQGLPYDRPLTTMRCFEMCDDCRREYHDPGDRRFHAQPNACPACGPRLWLCDARGRRLGEDDPLAAAGELLAQGRILAVKGLGGFHLAVDAANAEAVRRLRRCKHREQKPLAVMVPDLAAARRLVRLERADEELLASPVAPILLAPMRPDHGLAPEVAPGLGQLGVMLAYTPLHCLLLASGPPVLVMTSGNLSDEPICLGNREALERLAGVADYFLLHDRDIHTRIDDSVAMNVLGQPRVVRRARGYVPRPVRLAVAGPAVLALGPELKNTLCLTRGEEAFLSAHVGDLDNARAVDYYRLTQQRLESFLELKPELLAADLHPDYLSTRRALELVRERGLPLVRVQHHAAHVLAAVGELDLELPVLGLSLDGTGYGSDATVWGCELLLVGGRGFARLGHLRPFALPGGDAAARQTWRPACGLLRLAHGGDWPRRAPEHLARAAAAVAGGRPREALDLLERVMARGVNAPLCSSAGRLFDAVSALCGLRLEAAYEGQAPMELEAVLDPAAEGAYNLSAAWRGEQEGGRRLVLDPAPLVDELLAEVAAGASPAVVSARFHRGLVAGLARLAVLAAAETGVRRVVLSGGCFLNRFLLTELTRRLQHERLTPCSHRDLPPGDGGISLGQALAARLAWRGRDLRMWERPRPWKEVS